MKRSTAGGTDPGLRHQAVARKMERLRLTYVFGCRERTQQEQLSSYCVVVFSHAWVGIPQSSTSTVDG
jgi:hypothetical protein